MNTALLHAARPSDTKPKSSIMPGMPPEALAMARQLGLSSKDLKEMNNMWKHMDTLADEDPELYQDFIQEHMAAPPQGGATGSSGEEGGEQGTQTTPLDGEGDTAPGKGREIESKVFFPTAGFVIKTWEEVSSGGAGRAASSSTIPRKFFVNMTHHQAIERPRGPMGTPVNDGERINANGLSIPMIVSKVRNMSSHHLIPTPRPNARTPLIQTIGESPGGEDGTADGQEHNARCCDVVFHPWVVERCGGDNVFKAQIIELALEWVKQERGVKLAKQWKAIKSVYKGGIGDKGQDPVPFPVKDALAQEKPVDERPKDGSGKKGKQSQAKKVANLSPQGLLAAKAQAQREAKEHAEQAEGVELNVHPISPATSASHGASKESSVLIEDITDGPAGATTQAHVEAKTTTSASQTQPQSKPKSKAVKKGFLQGKNAPRLYSDSGSENGAKEGSYSRLMSKCKVVDMSSMTPEEQEKAMREHGRPKGGPHGQMPTSVPGPPQATAPAATSAPAPPAQPVDDGRASFQGLGSGFLDGLGSKRKPLYGSKAKDNDDLFDSLVADIDPDYANATKPEEEPKDDLFDTLQDLAQAIGKTDQSDLGSLLGATASAPGAPTPTAPSSSRSSPPSRPQYAVKLSGEAQTRTRVAKIDLPVDDTLLSRVGEFDVQVGKSGVGGSAVVRITSPLGESFDVPLNFTASDSAVTAKFSKKAKTLKVTVRESSD